MATFPGGIASFSTKVDAVDYVLASHINSIQEELVATQTEILTPVNGGRPNLLYDTLSHDLWIIATTNDFGDDQYLGGYLWNALQNGQAPTIQKVAGGATDPFSAHLRVDFDSAASQAGIVQFLLSADSIPLRGKTVSISADLWGAAAGSTNMRMAVLEWAGTADTLTSDVVATWATGNPTLATNWSYVGTPASIATTTTRTRCTVQNLTLSSTLNNLAVFIWTPDSEGSTEEFNVARVKLELGTTATNFIHKTEQQELAGIGQFYWKTFFDGTSPAQAAGTTGVLRTQAITAGATVIRAPQITFPVRMWKAPTLTFYNPISANAEARDSSASADCSATAAGAPADWGFGLNTTGNAATAIGNVIQVHAVADARL